MQRVKCTDRNGRTFCLLVEDGETVSQEWIDKQNANRAKVGRAAIVAWSIETA